MPASTSSEPAVWKRFFWATTGAAAAIVGIIYAFVVLVDPWNTLGTSQVFVYAAEARLLSGRRNGASATAVQGDGIAGASEPGRRGPR